jgi:starch synthase
MIAANYSLGKLKKRQIKPQGAGCRFRFGLTPTSPIFTVVSRLTWQKGMDVLAEVADDIVAMGGQLAVLGSGDKALRTRSCVGRRTSSGPYRRDHRL